MYTENELLKRLQSLQLEMLIELKRVCDRHSIKFYLAFGTCLGAIRHKGFIPWDDDIDVIMYDEDIKELCKYEHELNPKFCIQCHKKDKEFGLLIYRIRNEETTLIEQDHLDRDINHGVYIDIYPLLDYKTGKFSHFIQTVNSMLCRLFVFRKPPVNKGYVFRMLANIMLAITPDFLKEKIAVNIYKRLNNTSKSTHLTVISGYPEKNYYRKECFGEPVSAEFEGLTMPVPTLTEEFLRDRYGEYMKLPPKEMQMIHHNYVFADFDNSYKIYKGKYYCKF